MHPISNRSFYVLEIRVQRTFFTDAFTFSVVNKVISHERQLIIVIQDVTFKGLKVSKMR